MRKTLQNGGNKGEFFMDKGVVVEENTPKDFFESRRQERQGGL